MKPLILSVGQLAMTQKLVQADESASHALDNIRMKGEFSPAGIVQPDSFTVTPESAEASQVLHCLNARLAKDDEAASEPDVKALVAAWSEVASTE